MYLVQITNHLPYNTYYIYYGIYLKIENYFLNDTPICSNIYTRYSFTPHKSFTILEIL